MRYFIKKIYSILILVPIIFFCSTTFSKSSKIEYSRDNISNYFSGIVSANQDYTDLAFKYLTKVKSLKNTHPNFNFQFIRTLVLLGKFEEAFAFSKSVWNEEKLFFEADLLLGIESFLKKDYLSAQKHFDRLNKISQGNILFEDFLGNFLLSWIKADELNKEESFKFYNKIPDRYGTLKQIQNTFLQCYFDLPDARVGFEKLINDKEFTFSRYNFFLVNYLLQKNKNLEAEKIIKVSKIKYNTNLLIKQSEDFILKNDSHKVKNFFNCKNPKDNIAEIFYVLANLYSSEKNYQMSNFYLKISLFLNKKFTPNKSLLAENFFYQNKYELSKKIYLSLKSIGSIYSWYASKSIATILLDTDGKEYSVSSLENEFNSITNPSYEHYYELANFYKDNEYYKESIKYYFLVLENISEDHHLIPKILDRRGTSYERIGDWEKAEKDLTDSLKISPDPPYVLNYLAYSWIEKGINIEKSLSMLERATELKENDGYIIDSLGWAYYRNKNYENAEKFLQRAVELMPLDPIINDHYADALWMQNKIIQARHVWKQVLTLDSVEEELKDKVSKKLIFGINKNL